MIRDIQHSELLFVFAAQRDWVRATHRKVFPQRSQDGSPE